MKSDILNTEFKLKAPFLGTTKDGESFEYLLLKINDFIEIAICNWFVQHVELYINDCLELHLPQFMTTEYKLRKDLSGCITSVLDDEFIGGKVYKIITDTSKRNPTKDFSRSFLENISPLELLDKLVKDSIILKNGVRIYLKHLISYFSRIATFSRKEYLNLETTFLYDVLKRIKNNEDKLNNIHKTIIENIKNINEVAIYIDLEGLREVFESEISLTTFNLIFSDKKNLRLSKKFPSEEELSFSIYLRAIKSLEKRLYSNYNEIVLIYLHSLT